MRFWAFISYGGNDAARWAIPLQRKLETYRIPKELVGKPGRGVPIPEFLRPVCRDRSDFAAAGSLDSEIRAALDDSRHLIVICSLHSKASSYVADEIRWFKKKNSADRVFAYIVDGEPDECFPEALRCAVDAEGNLVVNQIVEPLAADARPGRDGNDAQLKLIAGMLGVSFDQLKRRDLQRKHRQMRRVIAASVFSCALLAVLSIWALYQRNRANANETLAKEQAGIAHRNETIAKVNEQIAKDQTEIAIKQRNLAIAQRLAISTSRIGKINRQDDLAALVALQAYRFHRRADGKSLPLIDQALRGALMRDWFCQKLPEHDDAIAAAAWRPNSNQLAVLTHNGKLSICDTGKPNIAWEVIAEHASLPVRADLPVAKAALDEWKKIENFYTEMPAQLKRVAETNSVDSQAATFLFFNDEGTTLYCFRPGCVTAWLVHKKEPVKLPAAIAQAELATLDPQSNHLATVTGDKLTLWNMQAQPPEELESSRIESQEFFVGLGLNRGADQLAAIQQNGVVQLWKCGKKLVGPRALEPPKDQSGVGAMFKFFGYRGEIAQFTPDGKTLIITDPSGVRVWNLDDAKAEPRFVQSRSPSSISINGPQNWMAFVSQAHRDREAMNFNMQTLLPDARSGFFACLINQPELRPRFIPGDELDTGVVAVNRDGTWLCTGNTQGGVRIWDLAAKRPSKLVGEVYKDNLDEIPAAGGLAYLGSADMLAVSDYMETRVLSLGAKSEARLTLVLWADGRLDFADGKGGFGNALFPRLGQVCSLATNDTGELLAFARTLGPSGICDLTFKKFTQALPMSKPARCVDLSRDGKQLVMIDAENALIVWKQAAKPWRSHEDHGWLAVALSADGSRAVTSALDGEVAMWDLRVAVPEPRFLGKSHAQATKGSPYNAGLCVAISRDGEAAAAPAKDNSLLLWNLDQPDDEPRRLSGHSDAITSLRFTRDGSYLVSGSRDRTVRYWSLKGEFDESIDLLGEPYEANIAKLAISPDGKRVAWMAADGVLVESVVNTQEVVGLIKDEVRRNLTQGEWWKYIGKEIPYELTIPEFGPPAERPE